MKMVNCMNIGCIGKIHSFSETNDGRYLISLQGTSCFKIKRNELKQNLLLDKLMY